MIALLGLAVVLVACGCATAPPARTSVYEPRRTYHLLERAHVQPDPPATARDWAVVSYATQQVGKRYCWGGVGPTCFDCSGLVKEAWASVGVRLPHSSEAIPETLEEVPLWAVRPGDILWWPGHLALYAGNGWSIEALDHRDGVVARPVRDPERAFRPPG